jgi:hypothetical protein
MAAATDKIKAKLNQRDIAYYLDAQQHNVSDHDGHSRKNGQFFALRERLFRLSDDEFEIAIRAIEGIVASINGSTPSNGVGQSPMNPDDIREFTELAKKSVSAPTTSSVKNISRV